MRGFDAAVADETPASPSLTVANCLPQFALTVEIHRYSQRHFLISCDTCRRVHDIHAEYALLPKPEAAHGYDRLRYAVPRICSIE